MLAQLGEHRKGLQIRGQADFQSDPPISDIARQPLDVAFAVGDRAVLDPVGVEQPGAVADAIGAAIGDGLEDRLRPVVLARVHRLAQEGRVRQLIGALVRGGRESALWSGQVDADDRKAQLVARLDRAAHHRLAGDAVDLLTRQISERREHLGISR